MLSPRAASSPPSRSDSRLATLPRHRPTGPVDAGIRAEAQPALTFRPPRCYPEDMANDDLLNPFDGVLVQYARARLTTLLGAQVVAGPRVPQAKPARAAKPATKPAESARTAKPARKPHVPAGCPVIVNGKRCGKPTNGPRFSFACKDHKEATRRQQDYASWKAERK